MSGTQDINSAVENQQDVSQQAQSGIETKEVEEDVTNQSENLSPAEKMDRLLRGYSSPMQMKKEIEKLRKEAAKYRTVSKNETEQRAFFQKQSEDFLEELTSLKKAKRNLEVMRALDKAGCIKSDLVAKDVPSDCENLEEFIENYKEENKFLFTAPKKTIGSSFKTSTTKNLSPAQQMDAYIRAALGR